MALNAERAAEEAKGKVRWLRPDYQIPRFAPKRAKGEQFESDLQLPVIPTKRPSLPEGEVAQTGAIMAALVKLKQPANAADVAATFKQGQRAKDRVARTLAALARMGASSHDAAAGRYNLPQ